MLKEDLIMEKQHDKQFKLDAIQYYEDHKISVCVDVQKIVASYIEH